MYLKIEETSFVKDGEKEIPFTRDYYFNGSPIEYEIRDAKGRVKDLESKFWSDEFHYFVFKQKIKLSKDQFKRLQLNEDYFEEYLIPGELYIEGQRYIEYPNIKGILSLNRAGNRPYFVALCKVYLTKRNKIDYTICKVNFT